MNAQHFSNLSIVAMSVAAVVPSTSYAQTKGQTHSPSELVEALHTAFGNHHSRAVHAKGVILEGSFTPDRQASVLTTAFHLQKAGSKVIVRFSDFTGIPDIPDNVGAANPRGIAVRFQMPDGRNTDIIGHSFNGFPTHTSDEFRELLMAIGASGPGAKTPTALDTFLESHPLAKTFLTTQKIPASYGSISYFGVNAFQFTNDWGDKVFIRYQFLPVEGEALISPSAMEQLDKNYLVNEIRYRVGRHPIQFRLVAQIAREGDVLDDPSSAWPSSRKLIPMGLITIEKVADNSVAADKSLAFSPNNIPTGIKTADPMLDFRAKAYPVSVRERQ